MRYFLFGSNNRICEERDAPLEPTLPNASTPEGVVCLETGTNAGNYYYTRDHLGSIRELTDAGGNLRARYSYDPFGRQTKISGDVDVDFGFAGLLWSPEANLALAHFRAYDPELGRWLSRDPLPDAERIEGPNLYAYVQNEPIGRSDMSGLACMDTVTCTCGQQPCTCAMAGLQAGARVGAAAAPIVAAGEKAVEAAGGPEAVEQDIAAAGESCEAAVSSIGDRIGDFAEQTKDIAADLAEQTLQSASENLGEWSKVGELNSMFSTVGGYTGWLDSNFTELAQDLYFAESWGTTGEHPSEVLYRHARRVLSGSCSILTPDTW